MEQLNCDLPKSRVIDFLKVKEKKHSNLLGENQTTAENIDPENILEMWEAIKDIIDRQMELRTEGLDSHRRGIIKNTIDTESTFARKDSVEVKCEMRIPAVVLIYIIGSSMAIVFFAMSFFLWIYKGLMIMHPFISFISTIGTIGLLATSILTLKSFLKRGE